MFSANKICLVFVGVCLIYPPANMPPTMATKTVMAMPKS